MIFFWKLSRDSPPKHVPGVYPTGQAYTLQPAGLALLWSV